MARAFLGIGSNIEPERNVAAALRLLAGQVRILGISTVYRTAPVGRPGQPPFYNCVVEIETGLAPSQVRSALRGIEGELGRRRRADRYAPRTIDLDLLLYDDLVMATAELVLPDPQIAQRPFLALPLYELAPELVLPDSGDPIREVAAAMAAHDMQPLPEYTRLLREGIAHES
jgi:2-amino-4-hydroxy-6-hydroxymethyldihydropteridine diphosphokinase